MTAPTKAARRKPRGRSSVRAAQLAAPGRFALVETCLPEPGDDQVLVRLEGCGICGSNLVVWQGREWFHYPFEPGAPGHEGWGIIESVGSKVRDFRRGDRVALLSYHAFAEYDVASADAVVKIPPADIARAFPAEAIGCALNVWRRSGIEAGQTVAIIGIGFLGALLTQLASFSGARVVALSRREFAL